MVFDVVLVFEDDDATYEGEYYLKCERFQYSLDRRIKMYEMPIFKALSQALGGDVWQPWATDWGQTAESFELVGVINEGSKFDSLVKMMEMSAAVRQKGFNAAKTLLYIGADPDDPTDLEDYAVKEDGSRLGADSSKGLEGKVNKITFEHVGNTPIINWNLQYIVCMDFAFTE